MKRIILLIAIAMTASAAAYADRPVTPAQLPAAIQTFIDTNFSGEKISYATKDDDFILPDYTVVLANGARITFENSGRMEKVEYVRGVPSDIVPVQIADYVKLHYPDSYVTEYEVGRRGYEVKLSNRLELKFNRNWNLIELDD